MLQASGSPTGRGLDQGRDIACWWRTPEEWQVRELFWYTVRSVPSTEYMIIDYLHRGGREAVERGGTASFVSLLSDWWDQRPDGGEGSVRLARFLETILLTALLVVDVWGGGDEQKLPFDWEEVCEELALHFSIDVPLPTPFFEWLVRLRTHCPRARTALDILGWADDDDDDDDDGDGKTMSAGAYSNGNDGADASAGYADKDDGYGGANDDSHTNGDSGSDDKRNEKTRMAAPGSGTSPKGADRGRSGRHHMERLAERRGSLATIDHGPGGETHAGTPGKRRCCLLRGSLIQVEISTVPGGDPKRSNLIVGGSTQTLDLTRSPPRTMQTRDPTVILATPPRLLAPPSRSSTPGCSQQVRTLSLEDD